MVEGFKLTAEKIKRILKLTVHLPNDYYTNNKYYPLLLVFDGGIFFSYLNEDNKSINLKDILDKYDNEFITIGLFKPRLEEWNISELNPYYSGNMEGVDISYSSIFSEYIVNDLIPLLKQKYRFTDNISVMGIKTGGVEVISILSKYDKIKKGIIYSLPFDEINDLLFDDLSKINNKSIYIYQGGIDFIDTNNYFEKLKEIIEGSNNEFIIDYDKESSNNIDDINNHIINGLKTI